MYFTDFIKANKVNPYKLCQKEIKFSFFESAILIKNKNCKHYLRSG